MKEFFSRHPWVRRGILMLIVYFCFHAVPLEFKANREYKRVHEWPVTDAVISSSRVYETRYSWTARDDRFCPKLGYSYSVTGRHYEGYNDVFDFTCWPDAYSFVGQHPPGTHVQIAYDPANPIVSIVPTSIQDPGYPWGDMIGGTFFLVVLLCDLFLSPLSSDRSAL